MAEEIEKAAQEEQQIKIEAKQTDVPSLYVDNAQFSRTEWDVRLDLGELHSVVSETKTMFVIPKVRLLMTPAFAERFVEVFSRIMEKWKEAQKQAEIEATQTPKETTK
jgi:hypothetical protein